MVDRIVVTLACVLIPVYFHEQPQELLPVTGLTGLRSPRKVCPLWKAILSSSRHGFSSSLRRPSPGTLPLCSPHLLCDSMSVFQPNLRLGPLVSRYLLQGVCQGGFAPRPWLLPAQNHVGIADLTGVDVGGGRGDGHKVWNQSH